MTPFEQYPHLFAGGKFSGHNNYTDEDLLIKGVVGNQLLVEHEDFTEPIHLPIEDFTLIARPISDMTEKEFIEYPVDVPNPKKYHVEHWAEKGLTARELLYLLSIGVYPFDQSHFEDGTVINGANHDT